MGIDAILACGAYGQSVTVVIEPGAMGLLQQNQVAPEGERNWFKQIQSLPLYDIERLYLVDDGSTVLPAVSVDDLSIEVINFQALAPLMQQATHVLSF